MNKPHNISQKEFESLESYILDRMDHDEKLSFEAELQSDPVLMEKYIEIRQLLEGIEEAELREKLDQFHKEIEANKKKGRTKKLFLFSSPFVVAASILIVVIISVYLLVRPGANQRLYAAFYEPDPGLVTAMSSSNSEYEFDRGMVDFKTGNYKTAIERWQPLLKDRQGSDTLNYFIGSAYLALNEADMAIPKLEIVSQNPGSMFLDDANWYLALAYIQKGQIQKAAKALKKTNHPRKDKLLRKIGNE